MVGSWRKIVVGWVVVLAAMVVVAPAFGQTGGVTGSAKDEKGNTVVGYPVIIERQEIKSVYKTKTDKHGNYIYIGLAPGNYKVTLQDPNGRTLFSITQHVGIGDPTQVDFDLAKERVRTQQEQQANPEVQKQLEQQAKEQKQFTGLKQLFEQATELYNQKKYAEAASMYEQVLPLAKGPNHLIVLARLADTYHKARQFDKAVATYQQAIEASPSDGNLHNNLGSLYADMGKLAEAQQEFQKAAQLDPPGASRYYFNLGAIMYNQGKMDDASEAFKKATEADPKYAEAYFMEGRALMGKLSMTPDGKVVAAPGTAEALQEYLKLEPNGKYAAEAQAMLQTVQSSVQTEYKKPKKKKG